MYYGNAEPSPRQRLVNAELDLDDMRDLLFSTAFVVQERTSEDATGGRLQKADGMIGHLFEQLDALDELDLETVEVETIIIGSALENAWDALCKDQLSSHQVRTINCLKPAYNLVLASMMEVHADAFPESYM